MSTIESVVGRVSRVLVQKGILHLEVVSVKGNFPDDISTWDGLWAIIKSNADPARLQGREKTPIEDEADRKREQEQARKYEAIGAQSAEAEGLETMADIPQDRMDPMRRRQLPRL